MSKGTNIATNLEGSNSNSSKGGPKINQPEESEIEQAHITIPERDLNNK